MNVSSRWQPYWDGRWVWTTAGWTWATEEPWGWATYHYGRWAALGSVGWVWLPGRVWGPAWVAWRWGGGYAGWCPLGPRGVVVAQPRSWVFVETPYFQTPWRPSGCERSRCRSFVRAPTPVLRLAWSSSTRASRSGSSPWWRQPRAQPRGRSAPASSRCGDPARFLTRVRWRRFPPVSPPARSPPAQAPSRGCGDSSRCPSRRPLRPSRCALRRRRSGLPSRARLPRPRRRWSMPSAVRRIGHTPGNRLKRGRPERSRSGE